MYKRNAILIALLCAPILAGSADVIWGEIKKIDWIKNKLLKKFWIPAFAGMTVLGIALNIFYISQIHITKNPWDDRVFQKSNCFPMDAFQFLKDKKLQAGTKIFNEFNWGGFLNGYLPQTKVFLDGRGTATWMYTENISMLQHYLDIYNSTSSLPILEKDSPQIILLKRSTFLTIKQPDFLNRLIFGKKLDEVIKLNGEKSGLEKQIETSPNWQLIYQDEMAKIWERVSPAPTQNR